MRLERSSRSGRPSRSRTSGAGGGGGGGGSLTAAIAAASPIMYAKLDDAAAVSGRVADYGSRDVGPVEFGTPTYQDILGPDGNSYVNNGGSDSNYFVLDDAADLGIAAATGKTFMAAYYNTTYNNNRVLFGKLGASQPRDYILYCNGAHGNVFQMKVYQNADTATYSAYNASASTLNAWNFLIARVNTDGTITLWHDSTTPSSTEDTAPTGIPEQDGSKWLALGRADDFSNYTSYGLAHMAIVEGALSDDDCEGIMQAAIDEGWTTV